VLGGLKPDPAGRRSGESTEQTTAPSILVEEQADLFVRLRPSNITVDPQVPGPVRVVRSLAS